MKNNIKQPQIIQDFELLKVYNKDIANLKRGESITVKCPKCNGRLLIEKSSYNGHLHIICENKDIFLME